MLKTLHVATVALTVVLFFYRFYLIGVMRRPLGRWLKILPHTNDTLLLATAVAMVFTRPEFDFTDGWIVAKLAALALYIVLGMNALHWARRAQVRYAAFTGAFVVLLFIVSVAVSKNPAGFFRYVL